MKYSRPDFPISFSFIVIVECIPCCTRSSCEVLLTRRAGLRAVGSGLWTEFNALVCRIERLAGEFSVLLKILNREETPRKDIAS